MNFSAIFSSLTCFDKLVYGIKVIQNFTISFFLNTYKICTMVIVFDYPTSQFVSNFKLVCSCIMKCINHTSRGKWISYIYHINDVIFLESAKCVIIYEFSFIVIINDR